MARGTAAPRDETDAFLMGGDSIPSLFKKAHGVGSVFEGVVLDKRMAQQTDAKTREKKFWDDGNPMMQMIVTLQTDLDDEPNEDTDTDDGRRSLYVKGAMQKSISAAVRKAGAKSLDIGGTLKIKYTGDAKPTQRGLSGAKQSLAKWTPPDPSTETDEFMGLDDEDDDEPAPPPTKSTKPARRTPVVTEPDDDLDDEPAPPPRKRAPAKKTPRKAKPVVEDDEYDDDDADDAGF